MQTQMMADTARLSELLDEALVLADALDLAIAAIHIDQARQSVAEAAASR